MKLATIQDGTRDGKLVVVSKDLTRYCAADNIAPTLQAALDNWDEIAPKLEALYTDVEHEAVPCERFHEREAHSPLPRAYQWAGAGLARPDKARAPKGRRLWPLRRNIMSCSPFRAPECWVQRSSGPERGGR